MNERDCSGSYHEDSREEELKTLKEKIAKQKFEILIPEIKVVNEDTKIETDVQAQLSRLQIIQNKGANEEESTSLSNTSKGGDNSAKLSPLKAPAPPSAD